MTTPASGASAAGTSSSDMQINAFLVASYLAEVAMLVFAALAAFKIYAVNWWIILLNSWQIVFTGGFLMYLFNDKLSKFDEIRNYMIVSITGALILVILHSTWQIVAEHSDTEEISAHNGSHLFQTYLNLAGTRITVFVLATVTVFNAIFFRKTRK